jgi:HlyD family secretion protein
MSTTPSPDDIAQTLKLDKNSRPRRAMWRWLGVVIVVVAIAGGGWAYFSGTGDGSGPRYITGAAERGDLKVTVIATGTLEPTNEVEISSELSGIVRKVLVDHNDRVRKGQTLAELDTDKLEAEVAHARAVLASAKARVQEAEATLGEAQRNFERYRQLKEKDFASVQKFDEATAVLERARASLQSARADVALSEADLKLRETDIAKACICSPIDGIVLNRQVEPGQTVASTLQAPTLFTVAEDLASMELQVDVDEADVSLVAAGNSARFTVDAYPDRSFDATIMKVRYAPEAREGVVTYKAHLTVDNRDLLLRPGMTATAEILVKTVSDALLVPNEALRYSPPAPEAEAQGRGILGAILPGPPRSMTERRQRDGDTGRRVWVLTNGAPVAVAVTTGLSDGRRTEIVGGALEAGQAVILDRQDTSS